MTLTEIITTAGVIDCACGATASHPCTDIDGRPVVHAARVYDASRAGLIPLDDVAYVIRNYPHGVVAA